MNERRKNQPLSRQSPFLSPVPTAAACALTARPAGQDVVEYFSSRESDPAASQVSPATPKIYDESAAAASAAAGTSRRRPASFSPGDIPCVVAAGPPAAAAHEAAAAPADFSESFRSIAPAARDADCGSTAPLSAAATTTAAIAGDCSGAAGLPPPPGWASDRSMGPVRDRIDRQDHPKVRGTSTGRLREAQPRPVAASSS